MTPAVRHAAVYALAVTAAGALVLALALLLGGGAPAAPPPGLGGDVRVPAWAGDVAALFARLAGVVALGLGTFALPPFRRPEMGSRAAAASAGWVAVSVLQLGLYAWEVDGQSGLLDAPLGRAFLFQALLAGVAAAAWSGVGGAVGRHAAWAAAAAASLPVALAGHPRTADHRWLAGTSLSVHVLAAAVWVGGLVALAWMATLRDPWHVVAAAYSRLAALAALGVAASGVVAALGRVGPADLLDSRYGALVLLKAIALAGLVAAGWLQRRHVIGRGAAGWRGFVMLAAVELATMSVTFGLAVALSRTPPPVG